MIIACFLYDIFTNIKISFHVFSFTSCIVLYISHPLVLFDDINKRTHQILYLSNCLYLLLFLISYEWYISYLPREIFHLFKYSPYPLTSNDILSITQNLDHYSFYYYYHHHHHLTMALRLQILFQTVYLIIHFHIGIEFISQHTWTLGTVDILYFSLFVDRFN